MDTHVGYFCCIRRLGDGVTFNVFHADLSDRRVADEVVKHFLSEIDIDARNLRDALQCSDKYRHLAPLPLEILKESLLTMTFRHLLDTGDKENGLFYAQALGAHCGCRFALLLLDDTDFRSRVIPMPLVNGALEARLFSVKQTRNFSVGISKPEQLGRFRLLLRTTRVSTLGNESSPGAN